MEVQLVSKADKYRHVFIEDRIQGGKLVFVAQWVQYLPEMEENKQLNREVIPAEEFSNWYTAKLKNCKLVP